MNNFVEYNLKNKMKCVRGCHFKYFKATISHEHLPLTVFNKILLHKKQLNCNVFGYEALRINSSQTYLVC